ncbi:helix-turn-helix domain-containing protein [Novosphingobium album (ex Hu et al. 2023)]|uniref:Helix-turn-helix domain-containing protein n=1 Tax=Novosphingobium album (ex Hu et al. 2023) TaxID=2930093 RepID=A0ABT0AZ59_9SPHN|nr:helix-turn-helix domain-containing protein [Novosphingobium album (ex Hu et al. 2023)]MCJ2178084.1 helix-turn-helix domain-containing protein [Novosphingobium album (ex Hu et al. 2023)]
MSDSQNAAAMRASQKVVGTPSEWSRKLSEIFVELEFEQLEQDKPVSSVMRSYPFGDTTFIRATTKGGRHVVKRTWDLIEKSQSNNFFIGYMLSGSAILTQNMHKATLSRADLAILDCTQEYRIEVPCSFDALWISVPRYRIEGRLASLSDITAHRVIGSSGLGRLASELVNAAFRECSKISAAEANRVTNSLLDILGISLAQQLAANQKSTSYCSSLLRRIQDYVENNLDDDSLTPAKIAAAHGVSARYVNKLFEKEGISTAKWLKMRRLERCRADLECTRKSDLSISQIAFDHGFGNISSFNRAFKDRYNVSPRAFRSPPANPIQMST